jgi:hypothetical protein
MSLRFRCDECDWVGLDTEIKTVQDPDMKGNSWQVCPNCRSAEQFTNLCDEPGCDAVGRQILGIDGPVSGIGKGMCSEDFSVWGKNLWLVA